MFHIKTYLLLEVYEKAIEMNLDRDFIEILEFELLIRDEQIYVVRPLYGENELDFLALQHLIDILLNHLKKPIKKTVTLQSHPSQWISGLLRYIRAYLPNLVCES